MKIGIVHRSLRLVGGGERVCLSLLKTLDRTGHDVVLRCAEPPHGISFAEGGGGREERAAAAPCDEACRASHCRLERAELDCVAPDSRSMFNAPWYDLLVVTDGDFVLGETAAKRVVLYCNSALREDGRISPGGRMSLGGWLSRYRIKRHDRRLVRAARGEKVELVPNSRDTMGRISQLVGRPTERHVYPPVDLERFAALGSSTPKERRIATVARFAPEKRLVAAARIVRRTGERWDVVGNALHPYQFTYLGEVKRAAGPAARFHINVGQGELNGVLAGAKAYLHASKETFGIAVAEAAAAGCIPVVPNNSAHPETVPFAELRYGSESEAAEKLVGALDGRYDRLLPGLRRHVAQFSEHAFQEAMLEIIEGRGRRGGPNKP